MSKSAHADICIHNFSEPMKSLAEQLQGGTLTRCRGKKSWLMSLQTKQTHITCTHTNTHTTVCTRTLSYIFEIPGLTDAMLLTAVANNICQVEIFTAWTKKKIMHIRERLREVDGKREDKRGKDRKRHGGGK